MVLPRSSSVPLHRLIDDEELDLGFMSPTMTWMDIKKSGSSKLDTDEGEETKEKLKFAAKQLNNRI